MNRISLQLAPNALLSHWSALLLFRALGAFVHPVTCSLAHKAAPIGTSVCEVPLLVVRETLASLRLPIIYWSPPSSTLIGNIISPYICLAKTLTNLTRRPRIRSHHWLRNRDDFRHEIHVFTSRCFGSSGLGLSLSGSRLTGFFGPRFFLSTLWLPLLDLQYRSGFFLVSVSSLYSTAATFLGLVLALLLPDTIGSFSSRTADGAGT